MTEITKIPFPKLEVDSFDYNATTQTPMIEGFNSDYMTKIGALSAKFADDYEITISLKQVDGAAYAWEDGSTGDVILKWHINPIKIPKPAISPTEFTFTGTSSSDYKQPVISGYDSKFMSKNGTEGAYCYNENGYEIRFSLMNPNSCSWLSDDEENPNSEGTPLDIDDVTCKWQINKAKVTIPTPVIMDDTIIIEDEITLTYTGSSQTIAINNAPVTTKLVTSSGYTSAANVNHYSITYSLLYPDSSYWDDEEQSTSPKKINWQIIKRVDKLSVPYLENAQKVFAYDGTKHTPVISNYDGNKMTATGTLSSIASSAIAEKGVWEIIVTLKDNANIDYRWDNGLEEGSDDDIVLPWMVEKSAFPVPYIEPDNVEYDGSAKYVRTTAGANNLLLKDFDENVMTQSGTSAATYAGTYNLIYSLKDPDSASWEYVDENGDKAEDSEPKTVSWTINPAKIPVPIVESPEVEARVIYFSVNNSAYYLTTMGQTLRFSNDSDINWNLLTVTGNTGGSPGDYTAVVSARNPSSCIWADGTPATKPKTIEWKIVKKVVTCTKPSINEKKFTYDGKTHTITLDNYPQTIGVETYKRNGSNPTTFVGYSTINVTSYSGTLSAIEAETYTVTVSTVNNDYFDCRWEDGTKDPVELSWVIEKSAIPVPEITPKTFEYDGLTHTVAETGYDANTMLRSSDSQLSGSATGEYKIIYSLKHPESAVWKYTDENGVEIEDAADKVLKWSIVQDKPIKIPTVEPLTFTFTGSRQAPAIEYDTNSVKMEGTAYATNANGFDIDGNVIKYKITFTLKDENAHWTDGTSEPKVFEWEITKQIIKLEKPKIDASTVEFDYDGKAHHPTLIGVDASKMTVVYDKTDVGNTAVIKAGEYTVTVVLNTSDNYDYRWEDETTKPVEFLWSIRKITIAVPTISQSVFYYGHNYEFGSSYNRQVHYAYKQPEVTGFNPEIMESSGITANKFAGYKPIGNSYQVQTTTAPGKYYGNMEWSVGKYYIKISLKDPDSCSWSDSDADKIEYEWSIIREIKLLPKPYLNSDNSTFEYDNTEKTPLVTNGTGTEGVIIAGDTGATKKGDYTISCTPYRKFELEDDYDYRWEDNTIDTILLPWSISGGTAEIPTIESKSYPYDGKPHLPAISGLDEKLVRVDGYTEKTEYGEYTITFTLKDSTSSTWRDGTTELVELKWNITKQIFDKPTISPDFMQYDGEEHTVEFEGDGNDHSFAVSGFNPDTMIYDGDINKTAVGKYTTVISLKHPNSCTWADGSVDPVELDWEIRKKTVLLDKPYLEAAEYDYDGTTHTSDIVGWKIHGMYIKEGSVTAATAAGNYKITLCLVEDPNIIYLWGDAIQNAVDGEVELDWTINKITIPKPGAAPLNFEYDGNKHSPVITGYDNSTSKMVSCIGTTEAVNADKYTVTFHISDSSSCTWEDDSAADVVYNWVIEKKTITLDYEKPSISPTFYEYNGKSHTPDLKNYYSEYMTVGGDTTKTNVDKYRIIFSLLVKQNYEYKWEDGSTDDIVCDWEIVPKKLAKPTLENDKFSYSGTNIIPIINDFDDSFMYIVTGGVSNAKKADKYEFAIRLRSPGNCVWEDGSTDDIVLNWEIEKRTDIEVPTATELLFSYDGELHAPIISEYDKKLIVQSGTASAINATSVDSDGNVIKYKITFSLRDTESESWTDGSTDPVTVEWEIAKRIVPVPEFVTRTFRYSGGEYAVAFRQIDPLVSLVSGSKMEGTNAGEYKIYCDLPDKTNYIWSDGTSNRLTLTWKILRKPCVKPYLEKYAFLYTGKPQTPIIKEFKSNAMTKSGNTVGTNIDEYAITVKLLPNYEWDDGSIDDIVLKWYIAETIMPVPKVTDLEFLYNGTEHAPEIEPYDNDAVLQYGTIKAANAGKYTIEFRLRDSTRCLWEDLTSAPKIFEWVIRKVTVKKPTAANTEFVYNGGLRRPTINVKDGSDLTLIKLGGTTEEINAGNYTVTVSLPDSINYEWDDGTDNTLVFPWVISRKTVETPYLEPNIFEYTGGIHTPEIINFNNLYMEIAPYSNSTTSASAVGEYHIDILLGQRKYYSSGGYYYLRNWQWSDGNYTNLRLSWEIVMKGLDYPTISNTTFVYDGNRHSPLFVGFNPSIMTAVGISSAVNAGEYEVGFKLTDTNSYCWKNPDDEGKKYKWEILKAKLDKKLDLPYQDGIVIYNGGNQYPQWADYDPNKLNITGETSGTNAGEYTVLFTPADNYIWNDGTADSIPVTWEIQKLGIADPVQNPVLYYNGSSQTPTWRLSHSRVNVTYSGEISGMETGEYEVTCVCDDNAYFLSTGTDTCIVYWKIMKKSLSAPIVRQRYPYTGDVITPQFDNYDPNVLEMSGKTEGIDAGGYTAYFEIRDEKNYTWGSNVYINPQINKAAVEWRIIYSPQTVYEPYQSNWLIYNGKKQSPAFANYNTSYMMLLGGIPSRTNAGIYYVTFRLNGNTVWSDGTTEDKVVPWEIEKKKYKTPSILKSIATGGMYYYAIEGKRYPVWANYDPDVMMISGDLYDIDGTWHTTYFDFKDPNNYAWSDGNSDTYTIQWKLSDSYEPVRVPGTNDRRVHIPRQIRAPFEDGKTKYPTWDSFDSTAIIKIGGDWEGINANTYYVILELRDGYIWEDETVDIKVVPWKILAVGDYNSVSPNLVPIHIPKQINVPYYDGFVKEPEWDNWDKFGFDIVSGDLYGVLAGTYRVKLRAQEGYEWEDGTTDDKPIEWVINPRKTEEPTQPVPKEPLPERDGTEGGEPVVGSCSCCCCDTGLFDMLNNACSDDGLDCDCTKGVEI